MSINENFNFGGINMPKLGNFSGTESLKQKIANGNGVIKKTSIFNKSANAQSGYNVITKDLSGATIQTKEWIDTKKGHNLEFRDGQGNVIKTFTFTHHNNPAIIDRTDLDANGKAYRSFYSDGKNEVYKDKTGKEISAEEWKKLDK